MSKKNEELSNATIEELKEKLENITEELNKISYLPKNKITDIHQKRNLKRERARLITFINQKELVAQ